MATDGLGAAARGPRWWLTAFVRQPLVSATLVAAVAVCVLLVVLRPTEWLADVGKHLLMMSWLAILPVRDWALRLEAASGRPMSPHPWRSPVDVSGAPPVRPRWTWSGPLGRTCLALGLWPTLGAVTLTAGAVELFRRPDAGAGDVVAALVVTVLAVVLAVVAWVVLGMAPGDARTLARSTRPPTTVRVLGIDPKGQCWLVRPVDGGRTIRLAAFRGRTRLVAGDVVHLWQPYTVEDRDGTERVALTGPFGTLWPTVETAAASAATAAGHDTRTTDATTSLGGTDAAASRSTGQDGA